MDEAYLGTIMMWAGAWVPSGWALCDGRVMQIAQNQALFAVIGTTYGGNGTTTFNLPDLRGRFPIGPGSGPGLTPRSPGQGGGAETVTLTAAQMPAHNHLVNADGTQGSVDNPEGLLPAAGVDTANNPVMLYGTTANKTMSPQMIGQAGQGQAHANVPPFMCVSFIIALQGLFPPRD